MTNSSTKAGFVAIIGQPNAGKSTLLNRFLGSKLSIVTSSAQTTRERVVGIDTRNGVQYIFLDTPGLVDPAYLLHHSMLDIAARAVADADVVVLLLDGERDAPPLSAEMTEVLQSFDNRMIPVINKLDAASEGQRKALRDWVADTFSKLPVEISAERGDGVDYLRDRIAELLPVSSYLYPEDDISTQTVRFFVSELVREVIFEQYGQEIPYSTVVKVEEFLEDRDPILIRANVFVERNSQKGILIGQGGSAIRELGTAARARIETFLGRHVYLELRVKVLPGWRKDPVELTRLGFPVPPRNR
ncbi:MAG: GTPase Era [Gemmatimonadota bacterium]|jgi:GTP-binding protein Era|nr:GTPase Era [Gemmatimonadota bacterium]